MCFAETLSLTTPRESVLSDQPITMPEIVVYPIAGGILVNGTLLDSVDENRMRDREPGDYLTLSIVLTNDTWSEDLGAGPNEATRAFAMGLSADESNTNTCQEYDTDNYCIKGGWMEVIQPVLKGPSGYYMIQRMSDVEVRVILPAFPTYDVYSPDLINIYIPPESVFSNQLIIASTQIRIDATRGLLQLLGGSLMGDNREEKLQAEGSTLTIELLLKRDSWIPSLGQPQAYLRTRALLNGLRRRYDPDPERPAESNGWNDVILPKLVASCTSLDCYAVTRISSELVIITLDGYVDYDSAN